DTFLRVVPVVVVVLLQIAVPSLCRRNLAYQQVDGNGRALRSYAISSMYKSDYHSIPNVFLMTLLDLPAFFISIQANLVSTE
ncbi:hypothetical protein, partial [Streptococcus constellatus]